jgi:glycosyltransferase involved in cell wall biosynthesis
VLEAMAQATPVITSAGTATEEVVGDAGVVVDPRDVDAIAGALRDLLDDPAGAARLGRAGQERARERFTWTGTADGLVAAYEAAIEVADLPAGRRRR